MTTMTKIFDPLTVYPVGAIYLSASAVSPAQLFGGVWERIQGKFLLAADSTHEAGSEGGAETHHHSTGGHALTTEELPSHAHTVGAHKHTVPKHGHGFTQPKTPKLTHSVTQPAFTMPAHEHSFGGWVPITSTSSIRDKLMAANGQNATVPGTVYTGSSTWGGISETNKSTAIACTRSTNAAVGDHAATACTGGAVSDKAAFDTNESAAFNSGAAGGGSAHSHGDTGASSSLPPYLAVYVWQRTA